MNELVDIVAEVAGKRINVEWVKGPVGVQTRNFSNERIYSTRLARPGVRSGGHRADLSVDRGTGEEGAGGKVVMILPYGPGHRGIDGRRLLASMAGGGRCHRMDREVDLIEIEDGHGIT